MIEIDRKVFRATQEKVSAEIMELAGLAFALELLARQDEHLSDGSIGSSAMFSVINALRAKCEKLTEAHQTAWDAVMKPDEKAAG